jgi:glycosyltransferase involved in cell wall biosynthesis
VKTITKAELGIFSEHVVGYVGSFNSYEGLEDLVRAAAGLRRKGLDLALLLVGGSGVSGMVPSAEGAPCPVANSLRRLAEELGVSDRLVMPGRVRAEDAPAYYAAMDLIVIPRKSMEVTEIVPPLKPLEALAAGKTVLLSDVAPLKELATKEPRFHCFEKGNLESLIRKMEHLLTAGIPGSNTKSPLLHRWDWSKVVEPMVQRIARGK